jgi:hypothetical protein
MKPRRDEPPFVRLIQSAVDFANEPMPRIVRDVEKHFTWALDWSRDRVRDLGSRAAVRELLKPERDKPVSIAGVQGSWKELRLVLHMLADLAQNRQRLREIRAYVQPKLLPKIQKLVTVVGYSLDDDGDLVEVPVPIWNRIGTCALHATALLLNDYRGLGRKVRKCPYLRTPGRELDDPEHLIREPVMDNELHFFVDARFKRGQRQLYCSPEHQKAHAMRRLRKGRHDEQR